MEMPQSGGGNKSRVELTGLETEKQREGFERMLRTIVERTSDAVSLHEELVNIISEHGEVLPESTQTLLNNAITELNTFSMDMAAESGVAGAQTKLLQRLSEVRLSADAYLTYNFPEDFGIRNHVRRLFGLTSNNADIPVEPTQEVDIRI